MGYIFISGISPASAQFSAGIKAALSPAFLAAIIKGKTDRKGLISPSKDSSTPKRAS